MVSICERTLSALESTPPPSSFKMLPPALSDVSDPEDLVTAQAPLAASESEKKAEAAATATVAPVATPTAAPPQARATSSGKRVKFIESEMVKMLPSSSFPVADFSDEGDGFVLLALAAL